MELVANGDRLRYRPRDAVPPDLLEAMKEHRGEMLTLLQQEVAPSAARGQDAQALLSWARSFAQKGIETPWERRLRVPNGGVVVEITGPSYYTDLLADLVELATSLGDEAWAQEKLSVLAALREAAEGPAQSHQPVPEGASCVHQTNAEVQGRWRQAGGRDVAVCACCGGPTANVVNLICRPCGEEAG